MRKRPRLRRVVTSPNGRRQRSAPRRRSGSLLPGDGLREAPPQHVSPITFVDRVGHEAAAVTAQPNNWLDILDQLYDGSWNPELQRYRSPFVFRGTDRSDFGLTS